jgi:hypothetical protein
MGAGNGNRVATRPTPMKRPRPWLLTALLLAIAYGAAYYALQWSEARTSQPDAETCSPSASSTHTRACP